MYHYAVVEFEDDYSTMDIVAISWLIGDGKRTYWPRKGCSMHQKRNTPPSQDWEVCKVKRVLSRAISYAEARRMLIKLEETSDYVPSEEGGRGKKRRCIPVDSSSDDELPAGKRRQQNLRPEGNSLLECMPPRPPSRLFEDDPQLDISAISATSEVINLIPVTENSALSEYALVSRQEFEAFKMEHFSMLNRILVGQQNIEAMLTDVKRQTGAPSREPLPEGAPQLPLKTEAEIFGLEQWLLDKMNRSSLMSHLALIGGKDIEKATRNLMGRIFSRDVAPLLNWAGRGGKMAFSTLLIKDVVVGAALHYSAKEQANTISRVEEAIKIWLKTAKCRLPKTNDVYKM